MKKYKIRPFIASKDFEVSKSFYIDLGFEKSYDASDLVIFTLNDASFFLQNAYDKTWAENTMVQLVVDSLENFHDVAINLVDKYQNIKVNAIFKADYGRTFHIIDPAGVLWHIME